MRNGTRNLVRSVVIGVLSLAGSLPSCQSSHRFTIKAQRYTFKAEDGGSLVAYRLASGHHKNESPYEKGLLFYVQGSDYEPVLSRVKRLAGAAEIGMFVVVLEKRGVHTDGTVDLTECHRHSAKEDRVSDCLFVLRKFLESVPKGKPIVLIGGSEGGAIAARVAAMEERVSHLVLVGSGGGWTEEEEIRHVVSGSPGYLGLNDLRDLDDRMERIRKNPDSLEVWAGHPYRRWSSYLWERTLDDLARVDVPILLIHGDQDESVPVQSARAIKAAFDARGAANLRYVEISSADHSFHSSGDGTDLFPLVELEVVRWLHENGAITREDQDCYDERIRSAHPGLFH